MRRWPRRRTSSTGPWAGIACIWGRRATPRSMTGWISRSSARAEDADFVLNTGILDYADTVDDYAVPLADAAALDLPMVCANPDLVVVIGDTPSICAGALAKRYEDLGGLVAYHGKPYPSVYRRCFQLMGDVDMARILAVGDSFRTDVAGANAVGIDSLLVAGGIHADELSAGPQGGLDVGCEPGDPVRDVLMLVCADAIADGIAHGLFRSHQDALRGGGHAVGSGDEIGGGLVREIGSRRHG